MALTKFLLTDPKYSHNKYPNCDNISEGICRRHFAYYHRLNFEILLMRLKIFNNIKYF